MKRLLTALCLIALLVAPGALAQLVSPPDPPPQDCGVDEGLCVDEYYFCLNHCEGKDGSHSDCINYICPDGYNTCLYGAFHIYAVQTHKDTRTRACVDIGFQLPATHYVIIDRTTTYLDQICPYSTTTYT